MFDWSEYLALARTLSAASEEAAWRSAISRAYYAAFHGARRHVAQKWGQHHLSRRGDEHVIVWEMLKAEHDASRRERGAGAAGHRLKALRTDADYRDEVPRLRESAAHAIADAEKILALLL